MPDDELVRMAGGCSWTARQIHELVELYARGLATVARRRDTIATMLDPGPEAISVTGALSALGAVEMPLPLETSPDWARKLTRSAGCMSVVTTRELLDDNPWLAELGCHPITPTVLTGAGSTRVVGLDELAAGARPVSRHRADRSDPAMIMTTSGTTGRPKGALLPAGAGLGHAERVQRAMRYNSADVLLNFFSWQHVNARHAAFLPALLSGARMVIDPRFSASRFLDVCRADGVTAFNFMGAVCVMLLRQPPSALDRQHAITRAYGGPASAELVHDMQARFGIRLLQAYACTELGDVATSSIDDALPGAAGRPVPAYRVRVVDEDGRDVPPGQAAELVVQPTERDIAFTSYVGDAGATQHAWRGGWFHTGDHVRLEGGWLWFEGRSTDVVRRRGHNISPEALEDIIRRIPGIADAAVVGVPSELTEEEVLAVVVPEDGARVDPSDVRAFCMGKVPAHALPRFVSVETELPLTTTLKLCRDRLKRRGLPRTAWDAEATAPPIRTAPEDQ